MPIYEYEPRDAENKSCPFCRNGFERIRKLSDPPVTKCPICKATVIKIISAPNVGASVSNFDDRAKSAGFSKLKKVSSGEYEKQY